MFNVDLETMEIKMHRGDTGSFKVAAERESGTAWTEDDRMIFTVRDAKGQVVLQRYYRLDDQYDLGDGVVLIEIHNDDTDKWANGIYNTELRFDVDPIWNGEAPTARCVDALTAGVRMVEGSIVRTVIQSTMTIDDIYGEV
jgi:hypothetical protein